ncbi:MAG: DUF3467 domain-containing protein [Candidatus Aenigmatarchaeota archaeon]|nr:DUF3467 domain-containing protein [Candidatus Aenigmarchaeota archaeon]
MGETINISSDHSEQAFFADRIVISHGINKFVLDFTQSIPRFDQVGSELKQTIVIKHKTIIMDPAVAKNLLFVLEENIKKYEKNFGKIEIINKNKKKENKKVLKNIQSSTQKYIG